MIVDERDNQPVFIGRVGENNSRPVPFYIGDILEKYPDAVFSLMHKRYGDQAGYPVNNTFFDIEENLLIWRPQSGDLADEGIGELQIKATYNGDILKTKVYKTETKEALDDSADPPEPWESWVEQIEDAAAAAEQAAEEAEAAVAHEPIIGLNGNWYTWDPETEEYVDTENPSRGSDATPDLIAKAYANLTFPVSKGTQCYYSGKLYEAKQDIATSEAWTAAHWQETTIEEQERALKSEIQEKAPVIIVDTEEKTYHEDLTDIQKITFIGNSKAFSNARFSNGKNLMPYGNNSKTYKDVSILLEGRFITYNGVSSGYGNTNILNQEIDPLPAGNYKFILELSSEVPDHAKTRLFIKYSSNPSLLVEVVSKYIAHSDVYEFTATSEFYCLVLDVAVAGTPSYSYDNFRMWMGLYKSSDVITDTEQTVDEGETYDYESSGIEQLNKVDTMQHESIVRYYADTKTYVDNLKINIDEKLPFITPELFGAVGDGITDDGVSINLCLAYASANGKTVRGYKNYKTSVPVIISGSNLDIFINDVNYTGNTNSAVIITGMFNTIKLKRIQSGYNGLTMLPTPSVQSSYNNISVDRIEAANHGVVLDHTTNNGGNILYNTFTIEYISATNGNGYHKVDDVSIPGYVGECNYYNTKFNIPNGWAAYNVYGRMYNFCMETNVLNGIYISGNVLLSCYGFRTRELTDKITYQINGYTEFQGGTLLKIVGDGTKVHFVSEDGIPYAAIDVSEMYDCKDFNDEESSDVYFGNLTFSSIDAPIRIGNAETHNGYQTIGQKMIILSGKKICVPAYQLEYEITETNYDMRDAQVLANNAKVYATKMIIGVDNCIIHLPTSYCPMGYASFIVDQTDHTCTIYKEGDDVTPIFEGASLGVGVYKLDAYADPESSKMAITKPNYEHQYYDTTNEKWEITKLL